MSEMNVYGGKRLQRTRNGRMLAGVCSGIGEYVGIDPNIVSASLRAVVSAVNRAQR